MPHARVADIPIEDRRAFSLGEVAGLTGFAISTLYKIMADGGLRTQKIAGRRVVTREALDEFLGAPPAEPASSAAPKSRPRHRDSKVAAVAQSILYKKLKRSGHRRARKIASRHGRARRAGDT